MGVHSRIYLSLDESVGVVAEPPGVWSGRIAEEYQG
jgi:hypothetical protein